MTQAQRGNGQRPTPQQLRAEVEQARGQLADTVSELAHKADMKTLARSKASQLKSRATNGHRAAEDAPGGGTAPESFRSEKSARDQRTAQLATAGAAVVGVLVAGGLVVMLLRRRRSGTGTGSAGAGSAAGRHRHAHRPHAPRAQRCDQAGE